MEGKQIANIYGWNKKRVIVDLTLKKIIKQPTPTELLHDFIGGRGINSRTLFELVNPKIDPLGPENVLIFGVGPLTGTLVPGSGRFTVSALSPLTVVGEGNPCLGDSNSGGFFGAELKFAGYDQLIIVGKAKRPVYLYIEDENVEIRSADDLWGLSTLDTDEAIKEEIGDPDVQTACIGPAGENLCRMACIVSGGKISKGSASKCGMGAVMGSKNLKAVAVRGHGSVKIANPSQLKEIVAEAIKILYSDPSSVIFSLYGTASLIEVHQFLGRLATKNYQETQFEYWEEISAEVLHKNYWTKSEACFSCPLHCRHRYLVKYGPYATSGEGPEYVTLGSFGSKCGNKDLESILYAHTLCNALGLDELNVGSAIAWAMECWQRGILKNDDTDGITLEWGNHEAIIQLIKKIAYREGFGNLLAEGAYRAAKKLGKGSEKYVMHVKGQDPAITDPRVAKAWGLGYAVASRGGDHLRALPTAETFFSQDEAEKLFGTKEAVEALGIKGKGRLVKWCEDQRALADSLEICKFIVRTALMPFKWVTKFFNAVTGLNFTEKQMMKTGERIINVERLFNIRQGLTRKDDALPERFLKEPVPTGPLKGEVLNLEPMLAEYYKARGWNVKTGFPTEKTLKKLGLGKLEEL
ncbi:MAG: aldehyde ferredoxin oxidoreductase family protein [Candidatus Bathyarchaeia archaeon]